MCILKELGGVIVSFNGDINLEKENLNVEVLVGEGMVQKFIEGEINLPNITGGIQQSTASVEDVTWEIIEGNVTVNGKLKTILYLESVTQENQQERQERIIEEDFTVCVDIPGVAPGHEVAVDSTVENLEIKELGVENEEDFNLKQLAMIEVFVKVTEAVHLEVATEVINTGIEVEKETFKTEEMIGENIAQKDLVSEVIIDSSVKKIDAVHCSFEDVKGELREDEVVVEGTLVKYVFFEEKDTEVIKYEIFKEEFLLNVELYGAKPGMNMQVYPKIKLTEFELKSENELTQSTSIEVFVRVSKTLQLEILKELEDIEVSKESFMSLFVIGKERFQETLENIIELPEPGKTIDEVWGEVKEIKPSIVNDKLLIEGIIKSQILFVKEDERVNKTVEEFPFSGSIEIEGIKPNHRIQVFSRIEYIYGYLEEEKDFANIILDVEFFITAVEVTWQEIITGVKEVAAKTEEEKQVDNETETEERGKLDIYSSSSTFKIYVTGKEETVYEISERFGIKVEDILKANKLTEPENINPGQKLLIPLK